MLKYLCKKKKKITKMKFAKYANCFGVTNAVGTYISVSMIWEWLTTLHSEIKRKDPSE